MKTKFLFIAFLLILPFKNEVVSQTFHEIGGFIGPVALFSDYGQRNNFDTNIGNTGFGAGLVHYLNFSFQSNNFGQHFMVRNEFNYHKTNLKHYGEWVSKNTPAAERLKRMSGSSSIIELGTNLEYHPRNLREFNSEAFKLSPFASIGVNVVFYNPTARHDSIVGLPQKYERGLKNDPGVTFAAVGAVGTRYKLNRDGDLFLMAKWHYYFSDWVDGLNPRKEFNKMVDVPENKSNDWLFMLSLGYIYYLD